MNYLHPISRNSKIQYAGNKAQSLVRLLTYKVRVPKTWVLLWEAYERFMAGDENIEHELSDEIRRALPLDGQFAVRSSANIEDSIDTSFAGQFNSVLNVQGVPAILSAVKAVWSQACSPGVMNYLEEKGFDCEDVKMGVVIQEMVEPVVSGVAFSKNPITGNNEIIVEAVRGSGEQLVQTGITPIRWVQKWGTFISEPSDAKDIDQAVIDAVIKETKRIVKKAGHAVDLEWVWDGKDLYFVQMREITTLDVPVYSNRISKEFFPGLIKPLIWSINTPLVNSAWVDLLTEIIGENDIDPLDLAGIFYHRAYFNMGAMGDIFEVIGIPRESLELLQGLELEGPEKPSFKPSLKTIFLMPHVLGFLLGKRKFRKQAETAIRELDQQISAYSQLELEALSLQELQQTIDQLYPIIQRSAYYNITIPLTASLFDRSFRSAMNRNGIDPNQLEMYEDMPHLDALDPNLQLKKLAQRIRETDTQAMARLEEMGEEAIANEVLDADLLKELTEFMEKFGHFSDSGNDFSQPPWRENFNTVIQMIINTPVDKQTQQKETFHDQQLPFYRRWVLNAVYERARSYQFLRTYISSVYTYGYGLFRNFYLEIGRRFQSAGWLAEVEDIFYLRADEIKTIIAEEKPSFDLISTTQKRAADLEADRDQLVPELIYGDTPVPLESVDGEKLKGIATSHGTYSGVARVLLGVDDIGKINSGEVLVIPYSDVGWSPLFTKAGAVVAESGGILSHSSIIAREYHIPAVVSVSQACQVLDGKTVTVNGYTGEVVIHTLVD